MTLTPKKIKIDLYNQTRNTDWIWQWAWEEDVDVPFDFTGVGIKFALSAEKGGANVIELEKDAGITVLAGGILEFRVLVPDTNIPAETYVYDLRFDKDGFTFVYAKGTMIVEQNVTNDQTT